MEKMEPLETTVTITINEEWFMHHFEKVIKRYVKNQEKIELILMDLHRVLIEANAV